MGRKTTARRGMAVMDSGNVGKRTRKKRFGGDVVEQETGPGPKSWQDRRMILCVEDQVTLNKGTPH